MLFAVNELARHWWMIALRGIAAVLFGILALVWPGLTLGVLVFLYGAYALVDGVLAIIVAFRGETHHRLTMALGGLVGVVAGVIAFAYPGLTALVLLYIIAFWAILTGVLQIVGAVRVRRVMRNEWGMILGGAVSVLFGILLVASPGAGALAIVWIIGVYAIIFGVMLLMLSWRLRSHHLERSPARGTFGATA